MNKKSAIIFGSLTYASLIVLAYVFYKERTIILDASAQLFTILEANNFVIQINRFGAGFTQIFPLMASRLDLSMAHVAQAYSLSFIIFYTVCFFVILFPLKNPKMAMVLLFYNIMMVSHSFFWIQCELVQGVALTMVYLAFVQNQLEREKLSEVFVMLSPFFVMTIVFFYPLLLFILSFALLFFYLHYKKKARFLLFIFVGYALLFLIKIIFFRTDYDANAMEGINNLSMLYPHYLDIKANHNFIQYLLKDYYLFGMLFIASLIFYIVKRKYKKAGLLAFYVLGTLFIINISFQHGGDQFYLEPQYTILSVFVAFALIFDIFEFERIKKAVPAICSLIIILGFFQIGKTSEIYKDRLNWNRNFLKKVDQLPSKKLFIDQKNISLDTIKMAWASGYEFWLLSTIERGATSSVLIDTDPASFDYMKNEKTKFVTKYGNYDYNKMNPRYFIFNDTISTYKRLEQPF